MSWGPHACNCRNTKVIWILKNQVSASMDYVSTYLFIFIAQYVEFWYVPLNVSQSVIFCVGFVLWWGFLVVSVLVLFVEMHRVAGRVFPSPDLLTHTNRHANTHTHTHTHTWSRLGISARWKTLASTLPAAWWFPQHRVVRMAPACTQVFKSFLSVHVTETSNFVFAFWPSGIFPVSNFQQLGFQWPSLQHLCSLQPCPEFPLSSTRHAIHQRHRELPRLLLLLFLFLSGRFSSQSLSLLPAYILIDIFPYYPSLRYCPLPTRSTHCNTFDLHSINKITKFQ